MEDCMNQEIISDYRCEVGEGPIWHPDEKQIYWTDIPTGRMFRYNPATESHEKFYEGDVVGGFTVQADGSLLLFMERGTIKIWRNGETKTVIGEIKEERDTRFNDVIVDPKGRVFCGTIPSKNHLARLYLLNPDGTLTKLLDDLKTSNGLGFSPNNEILYFTETDANKIYTFDYNSETGEITNRKIFADTTEDAGTPDGLTVDSNGYVWSARWNGGALVRYDPDGKKESRVKFPMKNVTSVAFGGENLEDLYVTTAKRGENLERVPEAGALFRLRLDKIVGKKEFQSEILI